MNYDLYNNTEQELRADTLCSGAVRDGGDPSGQMCAHGEGDR